MSIEQVWDEASLSEIQSHFIQAQPEWRREHQIQALAGFLIKGLPARKEESWRYTDLTQLKQAHFARAVSQDLNPGLFQALYLEGAHFLVFINGYYSALHSRILELPEGVVLTSCSTAEMLHPELFKKLYEESQVDENSLDLLNLSLMNDGFFMMLPKDVELKQPIQILNLSTEAEQPYQNQARHLISVGSNSRAAIFEEYVSLKTASYFNSINTFIKLEPGSNLEYYKFQQESLHSIHLSRTTVIQEKDSQYKSYVVSLGGSLSRDELSVKLKGKGSECELLGFYHASKKQIIDHHTRIDHLETHGTSRQVYKGIIQDEARAIFNGKIKVHPDAQQTRADQHNANLLLSSKAEVDTKPELEIFADDVKCSHGTTVGQLNEEALFYLQTRGINRSSAEHLLSCAFANALLDNFRNTQIAEHIREFVILNLTTAPCDGGCHE